MIVICDNKESFLSYLLQPKKKEHIDSHLTPVAIYSNKLKSHFKCHYRKSFQDRKSSANIE